MKYDHATSCREKQRAGRLMACDLKISREARQTASNAADR